MQQRPQLVIPRRLPPAVGVDTAKCSFDLPSFCRTFDFFRLHFDDNELVAEFPAETKDKPLSQDGVLRHGQCQCHEDNETGRDTRKTRIKRAEQA
jgi:hypothetical protein